MPPRTRSRARAAPALPRPRTAASKRIEQREATSKQNQLATLTKRRDELLVVVNQLGKKTPFIISHPDIKVKTEGKDYRFISETLTPPHRKRLNELGKEAFLQRTMNSFAVLDKRYMRDKHIKPVVPTFRNRDDEENSDTYALVGFSTPLMDGPRRVSRAIAGYTPLYKDESHPDLWQMETVPLAVSVGTPFMGSAVLFGCEIPCVIFPSAYDEYIVYIAQNPDIEYKPFWDATRAVWDVEAFQGREQPLAEWKDVDLTKPRPWYMSEWSMRVMRLERGLPRDIPEDPRRLAMLGECRRLAEPHRRAPTSEAEWLAIPEADCEEGDDEWNDSDAESIFDNVEMGLPTSSNWDPITKKSTTPQGTVAHPYPEVVQENFERERLYQVRISQEAGVPAGIRPVLYPSSNPSEESVPRTSTEPPQEVEMTPVDQPQPEFGSDPDAIGEDDLREAALPPASPVLPPPTPAPPTPAPPAPAPPPAIPVSAQQGMGPPRRRLVVPPPNAPTVRTNVREQSRGFTVEPES